MSESQNEQELFWRGEFGDSYSSRNNSINVVAANTSLFARALRGMEINSVLELGANIGMNLVAIRSLYPSASLAAIEINETACSELSKIAPNVEIFNEAIIDAPLDRKFDLVLVKGVLIHINPETLPTIYDRISLWSEKSVLFVEYYNPTPMEVHYRGHRDKLFKRDFAGEFLDTHTDFRLRDYGFVYHRDPAHPLDDVSWFLMERLP